MRFGIPVALVLALAGVACAAHHPSTRASGFRPVFAIARGPLVGMPGPRSPVCLLSTTQRCSDLMAQSPPHFCLLSSGRCPSEGHVVPLASLDPR